MMEDLLSQLNHNAGAIQAVAACITVVLTALLALLTRRYVHLTVAIADSANKQVEIARLQAEISGNLAKTAQEQRTAEQQRISEEQQKRADAVRRAQRELEGKIIELLIQLAGSSSTPEAEFLRSLPIIDEQRIRSIRTIAAEANEERIAYLEGIIAALHGIAALQQRVVSASVDDIAFTASEQASYAANLRNARDGLKKFTQARPASERY